MRSTTTTCISRQIVSTESTRWLYRMKFGMKFGYFYKSIKWYCYFHVLVAPPDFEDHQMNSRVFQEPECKLKDSTKFLSSH
jgi:hypothetical protein